MWHAWNEKYIIIVVGKSKEKSLEGPMFGGDDNSIIDVKETVRFI
jgi:hypothetical protein